ECKHAHSVSAFTTKLGIPHLPIMICQFLFEQLHPNNPHNITTIPLPMNFHLTTAAWLCLIQHCLISTHQVT
ncbi:hypothetical protein PAXRUDRAFT_169855, partial [Paxillus rubicundulus Ve08.2h10]